MRRAVVILGMHRSGTSALTRVLSLCGATAPQRTLPPARDNPEGVWEPASIVAIHEHILQTAGLSWHNVCAFPHSWFHSEVAKHFKLRLVAAVDEEFGESTFFIIKDPRMCRLVPLWLTVLEELNVTPVFVVVIRNPLEVAASLKQRNGLLESQSFLLWLRHFLAAERDTRGLPRAFTSYESLLRDWHSVVDKIGRDLAIEWPRLSNVTENEVDNFLALPLRHHNFSIEDMCGHSEATEWIKLAYAWGTKAVHGDTPPTDELDAILASLEMAEKSFMPLIASQKAGLERLWREVTRQKKLSTEFQREREALRQHQQQQSRECQALRQELSDLEHAYTLLKRRLEEHENRPS